MHLTDVIHKRFFKNQPFLEDNFPQMPIAWAINIF